MKKDNTKWRKVIKIILVISLVMVIIILPDLLYQIRRLTKTIPIIKHIIFPTLSDKEYIQVMMEAVVNSVAVSVSILAYYVAKITGKTQIEQHRQDIMLSAYRMRKNIKRNSYELYDVKKGTGNIKKVELEEGIQSCCYCLFSAGKLTEKQRADWQAYYDKVSAILKYHKDGDEKNKEIKINEYCEKFFEEEDRELKKEIKELLEVLDNIIKGVDYV